MNIMPTTNPFAFQAGVTLVELMIAMVLGMLTVLAVTGLILASHSTLALHSDIAAMQDSAMVALNNIARSVRQAGYVNYDQAEAPYLDPHNMSAAIAGMDASSLKATSPGIEAPLKSNSYGSDVLAVRYVGSGSGSPDNSILNCAGFGVPAPDPASPIENARSWSIYYVTDDARGIPNLYCKYLDKKFTAQSIAEGVESFQVLYGVDTSSPPDGIANLFLNATDINALDNTIAPADLPKHSHWKKIVAVKIALLIRSAGNSNLNDPSATFHLFGAGYSKSKGNADPGTTVRAAEIPASLRLRVRKIYGTLVQLRNPME